MTDIDLDLVGTEPFVNDPPIFSRGERHPSLHVHIPSVKDMIFSRGARVSPVFADCPPDDDPQAPPTPSLRHKWVQIPDNGAFSPECRERYAVLLEDERARAAAHRNRRPMRVLLFLSFFIAALFGAVAISDKVLRPPPENSITDKAHTVYAVCILFDAFNLMCFIAYSRETASCRGESHEVMITDDPDDPEVFNIYEPRLLMLSRRLNYLRSFIAGILAYYEHVRSEPSVDVGKIFWWLMWFNSLYFTVFVRAAVFAALRLAFALWRRCARIEKNAPCVHCGSPAPS